VPAHYNTNLFLLAFPFIPFASHPTNPCSGQLRRQDRAFLGVRVYCGASYASASEAAADDWALGRSPYKPLCANKANYSSSISDCVIIAPC
jgi:hypothetical protein